MVGAMTNTSGDLPILSLVVFMPLVGMIVVMLLDRQRHIQAMRWVSAVASGLTLMLSVMVLIPYQIGLGDF